ncbi:hypothetical protein RCL1_005055 [Eukaryota sp. TZLM3-RCL]
MISVTKIFEGRRVTANQFKSSVLKRFLSRGLVKARSSSSSKLVEYESDDPNSNIECNDANACKLDFLNTMLASHEMKAYKSLRHMQVDVQSLGNS